MNYTIDGDIVTIDAITMSIDDWRSACIIFIEIAESGDFTNCFSIFENVGRYKDDLHLEFNIQGSNVIIPTSTIMWLLSDGTSDEVLTLLDVNCMLNKLYFECKDACRDLH